jgi:hypothetical protein
MCRESGLEESFIQVVAHCEAELCLEVVCELPSGETDFRNVGHFAVAILIAGPVELFRRDIDRP